MLREKDWERIRKEMNEHHFYNYKIIDFNEFDVDDLLKNYDCKFLSEYYYDSSPRDCRNCNDESYSCRECAIWEKWKGSEEQLSFNNWIELIEDGQWGMTQKRVNKYAKESLIIDIETDRKNDERRFILVETNKENEVLLFHYGRDISNLDEWICFKRK